MIDERIIEEEEQEEEEEEEVGRLDGCQVVLNGVCMSTLVSAPELICIDAGVGVATPASPSTVAARHSSDWPLGNDAAHSLFHFPLRLGPMQLDYAALFRR